MKRKRLTEGQMLKIIVMSDLGMKSRKIAKEIGCGKSTVGDFLRRETNTDLWELVDHGEYDDALEEIERGLLIETKEVLGNEVSEAETQGYLKSRVLDAKNSKGNKDPSRVLLISDLHFPYQHPDALVFLKYLKAKYKPTWVICLGDEMDKHSLSFHDSDPDLPSAGDELRTALPYVKELNELFPVMDILDSNHGSLVYRKAKHHGIPRHYIKPYNEVLGVDDGWQWHFDMTIKLPNDQYCYLHHGKLSNVTRVAQQMGMNCVQGHYHETFKIEYWGNPTGLFWGMQCGCLIDDKSYAFSYNNVNVKRPIIGTGVIIDSIPQLEPMILDEEGRWVDRHLWEDQ